ncbi:MAG TPA: ABC transporter permease subunit [Actinomycetota bacterium]|nr:ABC transporter permease subunit [Actinomycetota bacterium]
MSVVTAARPAIRARIPHLGRSSQVGVVVATLLVLFVLLEDQFPWPTSLIYPLNKRFDTLYEWIVDNQNSHWLFLYFFNHIANFLDQLVFYLNSVLVWLSWVGVTAAATLIALRWSGRRIALLVLCSFLSFGLLGVWEESMETLALMFAAVLVSLAIGIPAGVLAGRSDRFDKAITPVLDAMQIVPAFAYLMPVVIFFSVGNPAAVIATVVYAVPPAVRITALGVRGVAKESVEMAESLGATSRQVLFGVQLPLALRSIMLGVNQTIMMALSIVIIASLIGGGGLGDTVISSLSFLDVGLAIVASSAIVIMAIALDRSTEAAAVRLDAGRHPESDRSTPRFSPRKLSAAVVASIAVFALAARVLAVGSFPETVGAGDFIAGIINDAITWVQDPTKPVYPVTSWLGDHLVTWGLEPLRVFLTGSPWWAVIGAAAVVALIVSGVRQMIIAGVLLTAIGVMGVWGTAMNTASQVLVSTLLTLVIGVALGIVAAETPRFERAIRPIQDALQTLPQIVYLIPIVALFSVGRVPGVIASVLYATPVVIRLVVVGIKEVSPAAVEAARAFGATRAEVLLKVKIPLARPAIMLGINQGIIMVLAVVIVAGLVGGGALGYGVVVGLQRNEFGDGAVASLAILALGIVLDRVTRGNVQRRSA